MTPVQALVRDLLEILREDKAARRAVQERSQGRHGPDLARALDKGLPLDERRHALADAFGHPHRHLPGQTPHRHTGSEHR